MFKKGSYFLLLISFLFLMSCSNNPASSEDSQKPTVSILYPANNAEFDEGATITIEADATDNVGIKEVKFYIDDNLEGTDNSEPYRYEWHTNGKSGSHTIKVKAYDINNNCGESDLISVKIKIIIVKGTMTDQDGNEYQTVKIGDQWWMAENLKVTHYRNGDSIPNVTDNTKWKNLTMGAYCAYNNDTNNVATYGLLYNWYAVNDKRNLAPPGWHIPTDKEWKHLERYLGMAKSKADSSGWRGTDEGSKLKATTGWSNNDNNTNAYGFTALPSGSRSYYGGSFSGLRQNGYWWSATESGWNWAWYRYLDNNSSGILRDYFYKQSGYSVRCVKD